jgi:hypothetical protein
MSNLSRSIAFSLTALSSLGPAVASEPWRDIYRCGASSGHSFYTGGTGWAQDGISNGQIVLRKRGKDFDLQIGDTTGAFSVREDGAEVLAREEDGVIQIVAVYPAMTVETFLFTSSTQGRASLAWTSSKRTGIEDRVSVFVSACTTR